MAPLMAKKADASRPQYLVVFKEVSEKNTGTLSKVLKRGQATGVRTRSGVHVLSAGESGVVTRSYERVRVAATDLSGMATPHVAGMAALYLEQNPQLAARQLFDQLKNRARQLGDPRDFGAGLIHV